MNRYSEFGTFSGEFIIKGVEIEEYNIMQIIENSSCHNHYDCLLDLCKQADELVIASPFCFPNFETFVSNVSKEDATRKITFITTMKNDEVVEKIDSLLFFRKAMKEYGIDWQIRIDNMLHGKVYILKNNDAPFAVIITSANLTQHGLRQNHEWGCIVEDAKAIGCMEKQLLVDADIELTSEKLELIKKRADKTCEEGWKKVKQQEIQIDDILRLPQIPNGTRFFIKPFGSNNHKFFEGDYSEKFQKQHFANRKPKAVRVGDILITYAVGARKIISVFKVMSSPKHTNMPNDRWPWFVEANNLTTNLGKAWAKKSLMVMNIAREYAEIYKLPVTQRGGYNLNGLMLGNDKIQLTDEFGMYLFGIAMNANKE